LSSKKFRKGYSTIFQARGKSPGSQILISLLTLLDAEFVGVFDAIMTETACDRRVTFARDIKWYI
uniref:Maturase K n=1 Tax=Romanomermis culicivorax TaxID=13658 RepID=A0A915KGF0_ROMCU